MTDHDDDAKPFTNEQAAELLRNDPALTAGSAGAQEENQGTDDDATTPDTAVTDQD